ncbi:amidohydrolase family protein [Streptomyces sp. PSKA54]|uniref:Amidohydrolase family protein n=1 Tax=Streptomyces himalayensis subsp. aureolus TaxID=2758039 RepID=A0A7W2D2K1_9ACTN|nr:amidohydrolase family protein [Streptomyces himalayensis subsp. aureolus]
MVSLLLRDAELDDGRRADVRITAGRIAEIAPALPRRPGEETLDCRGGALLPGLVDHHLHLHALAAHQRSTPCGPPAVRDTAALGEALAEAAPDEHGWIRGTGYHETVAGDLDAAALDRLHPHRPVRIQHRSGALWILNTAAATAISLAHGDHPGIERHANGTPTGRLWRADGWLRTRLPRTRPPGLADIGHQLARFGITAVTDATPDVAPGALAAITADMETGALPQRVHLLGAPLGASSDGTSPGPRRPTIGPYKIVLADSGLPALDDLIELIRAAHTDGRAVAVHAVTREALVLLLVALREAGPRPGDRIEHAAVVPRELIGDIAALGLRVVTQPGFLADRGDDYARDVPADDHADLYRCRSLTDAGILLALSSDAPYGPLDPWAVIAAAVQRKTPLGDMLAPEETLTPAAALNAYLGPPEDPGEPPRRIRRGEPADLVLLHTGRATALADPTSDLVRMTLMGTAEPPE